MIDFKQFGGSVNPDLLSKYAQSPNWKNGKFENLEPTSMDIGFQHLPKLLYKQFVEKAGREPQEAIPIEKFEQKQFMDDGENAKCIWYGHSVLLLRIAGKTLLIDPMLGPNASPIAPFATKRFSNGSLDIIEQLPYIDLLLLSHDHYDHLDLASMQLLMPKVSNYYVALGTARHLVKWGVDSGKISEFDWWDTKSFKDLEIHFTPSRHFSGRGLKDRAKSLWGGWVINSGAEKIYFSGDSGYGDHFKTVGERLGPFDFGFIECGQYNKLWHQIHMYPEEGVQAALDAGVQRAMAVHWAAFALAQHHWKDPIERFTKSAELAGLDIIHPKIGELFLTNQSINTKWWAALD